MGNAYYDQLAKMIIAKPSIQLMQGEVCFYQGKAKSYQKVTKFAQKKGRPKPPFSLPPGFLALQGKRKPIKSSKRQKRNTTRVSCT